jgi:hypothetical protein
LYHFIKQAAIGLSVTAFSFGKTINMTSALTALRIPSSTSSATDFNFLQGLWKVHNRKLKTRLNNCTEWEEFASAINMRTVLNGLGNVENYYAVFDGQPFEGMAVRLFDPSTKLWTIHWIDSNMPVMDTSPVVGSFENGVGKFYSSIVINGQDILMLYQWDAVDPSRPKWSQAFSADQGNTWEWNWEMFLSKE